MFHKTGLICIGIVALFGGVVFLYRQRIRETLPTLIAQSRAMFSVAGILWLLAVYLLLWALLGVAFFLFIKSLTPVLISQLLVVTGIYAAAWSIGFLSVITPSGLGVREGVLSLLLTLVGFPSDSDTCRVAVPTLDTRCATCLKRHGFWTLLATARQSRNKEYPQWQKELIPLKK